MNIATATADTPGRGATAGLVVVGLGLLALAGVAAGVWRLAQGLGSTTALTDAYPWGLWIGVDFSLIAFSGAGFTLATLVYVLRMKRFGPALRPAVLAGLLGYLSVMVLLVLDLGRPDRFYHFLYMWNLRSPLFEISWCIMLYSLVLLVECSSYLGERLGFSRLSGAVNRFVVPISVIGLTLSSLHQSTLGTLYLNMSHRLDPLWFSPILPLLFFVSSIAAGLCLAMIAYAAAARIRGVALRESILDGLARGAGFIGAAYLALKVGDLLLSGELGRLLALDRTSGLMWLELGPGALVPTVLLVVADLRARRAVMWFAAVLILGGVMLNRFNATWFAQAAPAGAEYSPHPLEWLSTVGVLAGALLVFYLAVRRVAIFEDRTVSE